MAEKKIIVDGLRFTYSGMFSMEEFCEEINNWIKENGWELEIKRKLEHVSQDSKKMEYTYEIWKGLSDFGRATVRLKAIFRDVVDFELVRGDLKRNMQKGHALILIDGFLETDMTHRWWQKPWYVFVRTIYEKLVWKFWWGRYDGVVANGSYGLYKRLFAYFKKYKY